MAEEIKTEDNIHLENIAQFHDALKDLQEDLSNEEIIEKLSKITKEDIDHIKANFNSSQQENNNADKTDTIILDEDSKINEKLLKLLAVSGSLGEQGVLQATETLGYTELGQLFAIKEFGELIVETAKFSIALGKALGKNEDKEISTGSTGIENGISDYNNNKEKENKAEINTKTKQDNKTTEHKTNVNPGENVEIKIDKIKAKIVTDYIPIKERTQKTQNNVQTKNTKIKEIDIQR